MPAYYEELVTKFGANLRPMVELTQRIASSSWASQLFPSTSVEALGSSRHAAFAERSEARMVFIAYLEREARYSVHLQEAAGRTVAVEEGAISPALWRRISDWLGVEP